MSVTVGGSKPRPEQAMHEVGAPALLATPEVQNLIILRTKIRMLGVDHLVEVCGEIGLELLDQCLLLLHVFFRANLADGGVHIFHDLCIGQSTQSA